MRRSGRLRSDRTLFEWLLVTAFCAVVAAASTASGWLWRLDMSAYDATLSMVPRPAADEVVVVGIDDPSLAEMGRWPWRRSVHAALIERLSAAGARVIAFDVILHEPNPDDPEADQVLADAIAASGRVVLPVVQASKGNRIVGEAPPAPLFAAGAAQLGHIHVEFDPDGIARSIYLWAGYGDAAQPQMALAALQLADPARAAAYARDGEITRDDAWRRDQWLRIPFSGPPGTYPTLSYADVLRGDVDTSRLRDKVVFVGATALGLADSVPTPTSGFNRPMPGVEVIANTYGALVRGDAVRLVSPALTGALAAVMVIVLMVVMLRTQPRAALMWAFAGAAGTLVLMWVAMQMAGFWFPPAGAVLGCMLCYPLWSWRRLEAAQRHLDEQLDRLHQGAVRLLPGMPPSHAGDAALDPLQQRILRVEDAIDRLRHVRRFVSDTLDSLPVGAVVTDNDGRIVLSNREALVLMAAHDETQLAAALATLEWPPGVHLSAGLPVASAGQQGVTAEVDGPEERRLLTQVAQLLGVDGRPVGRVLGLSDITRIRDAHRAREETMHYLSHDLRSPIASILTLIEAEKLAGELGPEQLEFLRQTGRYATSALKLADDLFRLVRADAIDQSRFVEFNLPATVQDAIDESWALARAKSVKVRLEASDAVMEDAQVHGDMELVRRAVLNLLTNAIKYGPEGGLVQVAVARQGDAWEVSVADEGEGITSEQRAGLFRRFGRLKNPATRREQGVGLGLMIVKTVAERHGGGVSVSSEPGQGAVFHFRMPALDAA